MARKTGSSDLPLHYGRAPAWLFERMRSLAREILQVIAGEYGSEEFIRRLSDPYWFQALGCVLGFDWYSSGVTTTVCGAIKEAARGLEDDLNLYVAGGKGAERSRCGCSGARMPAYLWSGALGWTRPRSRTNTRYIIISSCSHARDPGALSSRG